MTSTVYSPGTVITSAWLNDVDNRVYEDIINIKNAPFNAVGDGVADDTAAITAAILAAAILAGTGANRTVYFPCGIYKTTGNHTIDGHNGLKLLGDGPGRTYIRLAHATNDLFYTASNATTNIQIQGFTIKSDTVTRTGGWIFNVNTVYNGGGAIQKSIFSDLEIQTQVNGLWFSKYEFVTVKDVIIWNMVGSNGVGIKWGQPTVSVPLGAEGYMTNVQIYGNDLFGGAYTLSRGVEIENSDAIYMLSCSIGACLDNDLKIISDSPGFAASNMFITNCVFDTTRNSHRVWVTGGGISQHCLFTGCWFASAGRDPGGSTTANGVRIDVNNGNMFTFSGCTFFNTNGTGLYFNSAAGGISSISGCTFTSCGVGGVALNSDGIYLHHPLNGVGFSITGNTITVGVASIRTSATTNRTCVTGNILNPPAVYGIPCDVGTNTA